MEHKEKIEEYKVNIRRKQVNEKIANLRFKHQSSQPLQHTIQEVIAMIKQLFTNPTAQLLYAKVTLLKQYTQNAEIIAVLKDFFEGFYRLLIEVDMHNQDREKADQLYATICTILINIQSFEDIDFAEQIKGDFATPVIENIKQKEREIDTIWFIANILYRRNKFSKHFLLILIKNNVSEYIKKRIGCTFQSESDSTIFYYFVGALVANLDAIDHFNDFKVLLEQINYLAELELEECYLYILDGLAFYASSFRKHSYQIFVTNILKKCNDYCRNRKSRFVSKYLDIITNFMSGQVKALQKVDDQKKRKLLSEQYQRYNKYDIIKNMTFCLQNRLPQIKFKLFQVAWMLMAFYFAEIDLSLEDYYLTLAEEIKNIQKYEQKLVLPLLKYMEILIISLLKLENIQKNSEYSQSLIKFIQSTLFFHKIELVLKQHSNSSQIINCCFDILAYLQDYGIAYLGQALKRANLLPVLQALEINQPELARKRDILVEYILSQSEGLMEL